MKILLIGLSGSGKSTVAVMLAEKYKINLIEADDEVMNENGGVWPEGNDEFIDRVFEKTNKKVISLDDILYVTSWLLPQRIKDFYASGFIIFEMHADFEILMTRKDLRDGKTNERRKRFSNTFISYHETILSDSVKELYSLSIDTTHLSPEEIFKNIDSSIEKNL